MFHRTNMRFFPLKNEKNQEALMFLKKTFYSRKTFKLEFLWCRSDGMFSGTNKTHLLDY